MELDALEDKVRALDPARPTPPGLLGLIEETERMASPRRVTRRWRTTLGAFAGVALVGLTAIAATTYQDYMMSREPYIGIEDGDLRTDTPIRFVPAVGQDEGEHCDIYLDFSGVSGAQLRAADAFVSRHD